MFSSKIFTPSDSAFVSFEPAFSPATTKSVFLLTLDVTFPPNAIILAPASSREREESVPVRTNVFPVKADCIISFFSDLKVNSEYRYDQKSHLSLQKLEYYFYRKKTALCFYLCLVQFHRLLKLLLHLLQ